MPDSRGTATRSGWRDRSAPAFCSKTRRTSSSTSRRPACGPARPQICEIGAVKVIGFEIVDEFETLVDPHVPLSAP